MYYFFRKVALVLMSKHVCSYVRDFADFENHFVIDFIETGLQNHFLLD